MLDSPLVTPFLFHIEECDIISRNGVGQTNGKFVTFLPLSGVLNCPDSPKNPKELFNLRHAQLRNVVERIFGMLKRKFRILLCVSPEFPKSAQIKLIPGLAAIHNFNRLNRDDDDPIADEFEASFITEDEFGQLLFPQLDSEAVVELEGNSSLSQDDLHIGITAEETASAERHRDSIAALMWKDYQEVLAERALEQSHES